MSRKPTSRAISPILNAGFLEVLWPLPHVYHLKFPKIKISVFIQQFGKMPLTNVSFSATSDSLTLSL